MQRPEQGHGKGEERGVRGKVGRVILNAPIRWVRFRIRRVRDNPPYQ